MTATASIIIIIIIIIIRRRSCTAIIKAQVGMNPVRRYVTAGSSRLPSPRREPRAVEQTAARQEALRAPDSRSAALSDLIPRYMHVTWYLPLAYVCPVPVPFWELNPAVDILETDTGT
ncbi:hypothetical protein EYF80_045395 [Liparis tanakae]|uniref:Uncharacterized protein n=1 Tax=Liparis tanakae TaxID=230148 RepID=A0A4Z2FVP1_9TELE|nr:hypothetical protein EYF80_045395 [Liparis tanakae]